MFSFFFYVAMYPDLLARLGSFADHLFATKEMKLFFKLMEEVSADRSQSKEDHFYGKKKYVVFTVVRHFQCLIPDFLFDRIEHQFTKNYSYDDGRIQIKKGQIVTVPAHALHHVEEYYPDREKFDPQRFTEIFKTLFSYVVVIYVLLHSGWSPENKDKRSLCSYMAFGTGSRNCVGMCLGMEELTIAICTVVQKFRFFPVDKTPVRNLLVYGWTC